ncbi:MAG: hypothetical protein QM656_08735 [Paracoccaceae bacterium]
MPIYSGMTMVAGEALICLRVRPNGKLVNAFSILRLLIDPGIAIVHRHKQSQIDELFPWNYAIGV